MLAQEFLARLQRSQMETYPAVGLGTEVRMAAPGLIAGALVAAQRLIHLAAFAEAGETNRGDRQKSEGLARLWSRRTSWRRS